MGKWRTALLVSASTGGFLLATAANAQDKATQQDKTAQQGRVIREEATGTTIIVTAQKRSELIQDVPLPVSAVSGANLASSGIVSLRTLSTLTPSMQTSIAANYVAPYIRGMGTQLGNPGLEPSVGIYMDDIYMVRASAGLLSFSDVDRVEVLKGPQGTLYGMNTTGGAIRIITKDPTSQFHAGLGFTAGNIGQLGGDGYISGPITDTLKGRIAFKYEQNDGFVKSDLPDHPNLEDRKLGTVRAKLFWTPTERLTVKLMGDYSKKDDHEGQAFLPIAPPFQLPTGVLLGGQLPSGFYRSTSNITDDLKSRLKAFGSELRIDYDFDDFTLSSISGYRGTRSSGSADLDLTSAPLLHGTTLKEKTDDLTQEFQAVSKGEGPLTWTAGLFYWHEATAIDFGIGGLAFDATPFEALFGPQLFLSGDGKVKIDSLAPYGQVSYKITPQWEVLVGARYSLERKELLYNDFNVGHSTADGFFPSGPTLLTIPSGSNTFTSSTFAPKFGVNWRPMDRVMFYASYTQGFKSGGFDLPNPQPGMPPVVDDEKTSAIELGWKTQFGPVTFNGDFFRYKIKGLQVFVADIASNTTKLVNAGKATNQGVEANVDVAVMRGLHLGANVTYLDAKFDDFPGGQITFPCLNASSYTTDATALATCAASFGAGTYTLLHAPNDPATPINLAGNRMVFAPKWAATLQASYDSQLPSSLGRINFNIVANYTSKFYYSVDNILSQPSKWLLNGSIGWKSEDGHFGVDVYASNLTSKKYSTIQVAGATGVYYEPAAPRLYAVRLSYDY